MRGRYRIAEKTVEIISLYRDVHLLCKDYACDGSPDFTVQIENGDIVFERERSMAEDAAAGISARSFSDGYLETLAVYRKIADRMLSYDTVLFHGSCVAVDGVGYLFTAKSGTGKSTHTRLWREYFGARAVMVNDDKPLIRVDKTGVTVFGTPWNGKHGLGENISIPLKAICVLRRDAENHIEKTDRRSVYPMLLQQIYRPQAPADMMKMLALADRLASLVPFYQLGCNMNIESAKVAYEGMEDIR